MPAQATTPTMMRKRYILLLLRCAVQFPRIANPCWSPRRPQMTATVPQKFFISDAKYTTMIMHTDNRASPCCLRAPAAMHVPTGHFVSVWLRGVVSCS